MITSFPTPYEDEWWYSVLCRYYVSQGINNHTLVKKQIFGTENAHMGTVFPNGTVQMIVRQLPEKLFDVREILLEHTTLKYFIRLYPRDEQEYILKYLSEGGCYQMTHLWKNYKRQDWKPRYCPMCVKEDPEPYYHLSHQIPMVNACERHGCKLKMVEMDHAERELNTRFYVLSLMKLDEDVEMASEAEMLIARLADEYLKLPMNKGITDHSNLITGLTNAGYWKISSTGLCIDDEKLYRDIVRLYGTEIVERVFGDEIARGVMVRIRDFKTLLPDRYVLLQGLIGMDVKEMLGPEIGDKLKTRVQGLSKRAGIQSLKSVANEMGVLEWQVRALCKHYGIERFWIEKSPGKSKVAKTGKLVIMMDERELEEIRAEAKRLGFRCAGDYVMGCVRFAESTQHRPLSHETVEKSDVMF